MKVVYSIILFMLISSVDGNADWKRVYKHYENQTMQQYDLSCADSLNCISLASPGGTGTMLIRTIDGGENWFVHYADTAKKIYNDKGQWVDTEMPKFNPPLSLDFVNSNFIVVGHREGQISISRDGGNTFEGKQFETESDIKKIHFVDENYGIVFAYEDIYRTYDGGENWEKIDLSYKKDISTYEANISVVGIDSLVLVVYDFTDVNHKFYQTIRTVDGGKTWIKGKKIPQYDEWKPYFLTMENGWVAGSVKSGQNYKHVIYHTTDGGQSWQLQLDTLFNNEYYGLSDIYFKDDYEGLAYGENGVIWRTDNGGDKWLLDTSFQMSESDHFKKLVFPRGDTKRILANVYMYGEIWLYDENLSANDPRGISFDVFPNPAHDFISLSGLESAAGERIEIYSQLGVKVFEAAPGAEKIDVSALPAAMYFIKIGGRAGNFVKM